MLFIFLIQQNPHCDQNDKYILIKLYRNRTNMKTETSFYSTDIKLIFSLAYFPNADEIQTALIKQIT
jgi:hypothetical protein